MLRQLLLLVAVCAAGAVLFSPQGSEVSKRNEDALYSFTWTEVSENTTTLRVCFTSETADCKDSFQLTYYIDDQHVVSKVSTNNGQHSYEEDVCCGDVLVNASTLNYDTEQTYVVNSEEVHISALFRLSIEPGSLSAENVTVINVTRVRGVTNYDLMNCKHDANSSCYMNNSNTPPAELCTQSNDSFNEGQFVLVCDSTFQTTEVDAETELTGVILSYDDKTLQVLAANSENWDLQVVIGNADNSNYSLCEGSTCGVTESPGTSVYSLVMIELDENFTAKSSNRIEVQDVNLTSAWLSDDAIGAIWEGPNANYTVTLEGEAVDTRTLNCVDCTEVFIHKTCPQQKFTVENDISLTKVVASVNNSKPENVSEGLTSINHTVSVNKTGFVSTKVCVDQDMFNGSSYLVIVDNMNKTYTTSNFTKDDSYKCAAVQVTTSTGVTRVIVTGYSGEKLLSTQADLSFFIPELEMVTDTAARASWQNLNEATSYSVVSPTDENDSPSSLQCLKGASCRYYVAPDDENSMSFTMVEKANIVQTTTTTLEKLNVDVLKIDTELQTRYDDHLLVCYNAGSASTAVHHELGMERDGELVVSDEDPETETSSEELCLVTSKAVLLGAYVKLWAVVAEFDTNGNVLRSGEHIFEDLFLSNDMGVYALVSQHNSVFDIRSSWKLVDDTTSLNNYSVSLTTENGQPISGPVEVSITESTYTFENVTENYYLVCVVVNGDGFSSDYVCSDIIYATAPADTENIPQVEPSETLITSDNSVKISWSLPDEKLEGVTAFLIEFSRNTSVNTNKMRTLGKTPLTHAKALQHDRDSKAVEENADFRIIPTSQTSVELPLSKGSWDICVSAMMGNQAGQPQCDYTTVDTSAETVPPPENVEFDVETSTLKWDAPSDAGDSSELTYYIEAEHETALKNTKTSDTNLDLAAFVGSGEWTLSVQTVRSNYLSVAKQQCVVINGIVITLEQTGTRDMLVAWSEFNSKSTDNDYSIYQVIFGTTADFKFCGDNCVIYFSDPSLTAGEQFDITVKNYDTKVSKTVSAAFHNNPNATQLTRSYSSSSSATISWAFVDGTRFYNVSLYSESGDLKYHDVPVTRSYTFDDPSLGDITMDVATVQACTVKSFKHPLRCGDALSIIIEPLSSVDDSDDTLVIVLSSVVGVLILVVIVGLIIVFLKSGKEKSKPEQKTDDIELQTDQDPTAPSSPENNDSPPVDSMDDHPPNTEHDAEDFRMPAVPVYPRSPDLERTSPPLGPNDQRMQDSRPPKPHVAREASLEPVFNRFNTRRPLRRLQSMSPERPSRRSHNEAQQHVQSRNTSVPPPRNRHTSPNYGAQPPAHPNRSGPGPRPGARPAYSGDLNRQRSSYR